MYTFFYTVCKKKNPLVIALTLSLSLKKFNNISHSANRQIVTPVIFFLVSLLLL